MNDRSGWEAGLHVTYLIFQAESQANGSSLFLVSCEEFSSRD